MSILELIRCAWRDDPGGLIVGPLILPAALFVAALWIEVLR
jgi:hypothetical protein